MAERIANLAESVTPEHILGRHDALGPSGQGLFIGGVRVLDLKHERHRCAVEADRRMAPGIGHLLGQHDDGIADHDLGVHQALAVGAGYARTPHGAKRLFVEADRRCAMLDYDVRRDAPKRRRHRRDFCPHDFSP